MLTPRQHDALLVTLKVIQAYRALGVQKGVLLQQLLERAKGSTKDLELLFQKGGTRAEDVSHGQFVQLTPNITEQSNKGEEVVK